MVKSGQFEPKSGQMCYHIIVRRSVLKTWLI